MLLKINSSVPSHQNTLGKPHYTWFKGNPACTQNCSEMSCYDNEYKYASGIKGL
jgi:hypothetical protein